MTKLQLLGLFVLFGGILCSCTPKNEKTIDIKTHDFCIPIDRSAIESIDWRVRKQGEMDFLTYIDTASNLYLFDIFRDRVVDSIKLKMNEVGIDFDYYPRRTCYHNKDSIFILPDDGKRSIFMTDAKGEVKQRWDIDLFLDYPYLLSGYSWNPLYFKNDKFFVRFIPNMNFNANRSTFFNIPPDLVIDTKSDSIWRIGKWPKKYRTQNFNSAQTQRIVLSDKEEVKIIYSHAADHHLYIFNEKEFIKKVSAKSNYINEFEIYSDDSLDNIAYTMRYLSTAPEYTKIFFDSNKNEYYRVALHRTNYIDEETNRKKQGFDRPWSIIVLDSTFQKIEEVELNPEEYRAGPLLMTSKGLLIPETSKKDSYYRYTYTNFNSLR